MPTHDSDMARVRGLLDQLEDKVKDHSPFYICDGKVFEYQEELTVCQECGKELVTAPEP